MMKVTALIILAVSTSFMALGQSQHLNLNKSGKAIQGYDPVSYFTEGKAIKGNKEITHKHEGVIYCFKNESNKELFKKSPSKYPIEYGGWCAYAMGVSGDKVKIDPETFKILDGKLYLFYNFTFTNTLPKWNEDEENLKTKADQYWRNLTEN